MRRRLAAAGRPFGLPGGGLVAFRRRLALRAGQDGGDAGGAGGIVQDHRRGGVSGVRHAASVAVGRGIPAARQPSARVDSKAAMRDIVGMIRRRIGDGFALLRYRIRPLRPSCAHIGGERRIGSKGLPNLAPRGSLRLARIATDRAAVAQPIEKRGALIRGERGGSVAVRGHIGHGIDGPRADDAPQGRKATLAVAPLYFAQRLTEASGGARIYLKREDLAHTGAHKINNTVGQGLLARRMGKTRLIAETGAGQHGVATATVAALLGLSCDIYMGTEDIRRQRLNVIRAFYFFQDALVVLRVLGGGQHLIDGRGTTWPGEDRFQPFNRLCRPGGMLATQAMVVLEPLDSFR